MTAQPVELPRPRVRLRKDGSLVRVDAALYAQYLDAYRKAIEGARYERNRRLASYDQLPEIVKRLRDAGFEVDMSPEVLAALESYEKTQWLDLRGAEERIGTISALRDYQRVGARWLCGKRSALLADQQRVGKTITVIAALPARAPVLVVCPATVKEWWASQVRQWRPAFHARILSGRAGFRWPAESEVLITNYEALPSIHAQKCDGFLPPRPCPGCREQLVPIGNTFATILNGHLDDCTGFLPRPRCPGCHPFLDRALRGTVVVGDEVHRTKGRNSARGLRWRAMGEAIRERHEGRTWGSTGTPMQNDPMELWYVLSGLGLAAEAFGDFAAFKKIFKGKQLDYGAYKWGIPDEAAAEGLRRVALRRLRSEIYPELPPKTYETHQVVIDKKIIAQCDAFVSEAGGLDHILEMIQKRDEIHISEFESIRTALATAKIPKVIELIEHFAEEDDAPLLVFSMHRRPLEMLAKLPGWDTIHGGVPPAKRQPLVDKFQAGQLRGLALSIKAAGEGLNLSRASRAIFLDVSWNPMENEQAEDRFIDVMQVGLAKIVTVVTANHPLDDRITEVCLTKRKIIAASVDAASVKREKGAAGTLGERLRKLRTEDFSDRVMCGELLEALEVAVFRSAQDLDVARDLSEEARAVGGLTAAGWEIAETLLERSNGGGVPPEDPMSNWRDAFEKLTAQQKAVAVQEAIDELDAKARVPVIMQAIDELDEENRESLFAEIDAAYAVDEDDEPIEDPSDGDDADEDDEEEGDDE